MKVELLESRITAVTVYARGARIVREARLEPSAGGWPDQITVANLPLCLDDASVSVEVRSVEGAGPVPIAVDLRVALAVPPDAAEAATADEAALVDARRVERRLEDRLDQLRAALARWSDAELPARAKGERGAAPAASPATTRLAFLKLRESFCHKLLQARTAVEADLARARERRLDLEIRVRVASTSRKARENELRKAASVSLRSAGVATGAVAVELRYLVPGARWAPAYSLRLSHDMAHAELAMRALVCQQTGEDWQDVAVTLSTAKLLRWTELPELKSLKIGHRQPRPRRIGWRPAPTGALELYADYDRAFGRPTDGAARLEPAEAEASDARAQGDLLGRVDTMRLLGAPGEYLDALVDQGRLRAFRRGRDVFFHVDDVSALARSAPAPRGEAPGAAANVPLPPPAAKPAPMVAFAASSVNPSQFVEEEGAALFSLASEAPAAPPPPPSLAPSPQAAGALAGGLATPADERLRRSPTRRRLETPLGVPPDEPGAPEAELDVHHWQLDYARLRLHGPDDAERGGPRPLLPPDARAEAVAASGGAAASDLSGLITQAVKAAERVDSLTAPPGFAFPDRPGGFDYSFRGLGFATLPSDGGFHALPLAVHTSDATLRYVTVPRESREVFRFLELPNPAAAPLLRGPIDVYVGDDFLTSSHLDEIPEDGVLRLGLGVEERIDVARNTAFRENAVGLMGGGLELDHEIRIELLSHTPREVPIEVRERIPVAKEGEDKVVIELREVTPEWQPFAQDHPPLEGGYRWKVLLRSGERKQLRVRYVIVLSSKDELTTGNRREE